MSSYLFLLHQLRIGTIVHNVLAKHGRGESSVNLLGVDVFQFPVQDEVVALRSQIYGMLLA